MDMIPSNYAIKRVAISLTGGHGRSSGGARVPADVNNADDAFMRRQAQRHRALGAHTQQSLRARQASACETAMEAKAICQYAARARNSDPCEEMT